MGGDQCIHKRSQITQEITSWRLQHSIVLGLADKPCPMDSHCSLRGNVHMTESIIRYVQEVKDNWAWLVLSPHLKGCLFSELERFKERFKVGDPFQCHIRSVNHERKQVDFALHPKTSDEQFKKGDLLGRRITRVFAGVGGHTVQGRWESFGKVHVTIHGLMTQPVYLQRDSSVFVKNVMEKGCFVVLAPSLEARIQLKNLLNSFVQNPAEMFPPGKVILGRILSIEPLSGHIEMSLAATTSQDSSGWKKFGAGEIVSGRIHNIEAFGIFISLAESDVFLVCAPGCLCHVSEVSYDFIQDLSTLYKVGQWAQVKILKVDVETKRISLGMKASYLTPEDGIEPMEEEAINEEPSNTNVLMDNDEREEEDYLDLASKRFPQLCINPLSTKTLRIQLCLIGADHCKYPRTYASPEAIQRMEVYEFARVTSNSQFILLPFQPYKLIYASMLAEAGKINKALRYCQAVLKTLKTAGHAADVCKEAAVALEERLHIHSQGGSTSIVQRFFGNIGLHKMIGPSPPKASDNADINNRPATASSRSSVSLASSASMEPISDNTRRSNMPARSISEPDFRPAQIISPAKGTPNRGVFTSFVQRAMGFIKTPSKEAKLGNSNKFRYNETLKHWVEEGAEAQAPELPLAPPPMANKLVSRMEENGAPISMSLERPQPTPERPQPVVSGIPPMPPSSNQYAAHAHQNVRSRYRFGHSQDSNLMRFLQICRYIQQRYSGFCGLHKMAKASAKPLAPTRFFVPAAAAAAAPDINSNTVDPSSAPDFVSDMAFSNGNGAFAQPVVQDMRNDPGPTPDHLSSSSSPAMFYSNRYPAALSTVSLPPPPVLEVTPLVMVEQQQQNQRQESSIHRHHHQQSGTVGFEAASSSRVFGDDLQEVEL
ncbi:hypothetical protein SELMODRAFT_412239 [Selaginella moellendorffii]|uniref:S1 motif domain-containing protein n=1 Tax=Selaginella moellendorffii TaxID=88036 RepID=D8RKI5_SELML|nr:hypothetical protein SELMODRAFT_412239 [Selaginella moellendorffii]